VNETSAKVSIVLPTYNGAKYIRKSIDSCLNQTYQNIELVIVDDGSIDETSEIIKSYKDERIRYLRHEKNEGLPKALNTGFTNTTGEYLTWTSDDNLYVEDAIEKMLFFLKHKNCLFVYCDFYQFQDDNLWNKNIVVLPDVIALEKGNRIGPCFLYARKIMEIIGDYDPVTELAEDYDYWIRVSKKFSLCHYNEPLYYFRVHNESLYRVRYFEVKIVDFLVRLKNNISNLESITSLFITLIAQKRITHLYHNPNKVPLLNAILFRFNKIYVKILLYKRIEAVLRDYHNGKITFSSAKSKLKTMIDNS
jgi:glycosyltransferase involved in cell wall biosynthesis